MIRSWTNYANAQRLRLASWFSRFTLSGLDPQTDDPQLVRQIRVLNGLMLTAMLLCIPLGVFWTHVSSLFGYVYATAFVTWFGLLTWLQHSQRAIFVGRAAVFVLFGLCTASVLLLGGTESNLLAWYILMPLAAAVCVGKRDLWFWGTVATATPILIYLLPNWSFVAPSPLSAEANRQLAGIALALGALIASVLTNIWIVHHERLAKRLDDSVARLKNEAAAHRLLVDTAMLASGEVSLSSGVRKLLEYLDAVDWVCSVCYWDTRGVSQPDAPFFTLPVSHAFEWTPALARSIRTGKRSASKTNESDNRHLCYPILDGQDVVGVIEVDIGRSPETTHEGGWLLQQIAIQLGHIAERERTAQIIQHEAHYDSLTSLRNRRAFQVILEEEIFHAERDNKRLALLFIDLNDFKRVNDSLGHAVGDTVLQVVAQRLQQAVRHTVTQSDETARACDSISRVGGDEFTLVLHDIASNEDADRIALRILEQLSIPVQLDDQQFQVGASIGIAIFPDDAQRADVLVRSADAAMYAAKRRGGSGYSRYRDADKAINLLSFEAEIRLAIEDGQFEMHYQPVFSCSSNSPVGAEALIRWYHPQRGWTPPSQFIPLAEDIGLMGEIGKFQFDTVLHWFEAARKQLPEKFRIALNLSPNQIADPDFSTWLLDRLCKSDIPMSCIELEITETALLADTPEIQANVRALADLGLCITLDDFGTGQSSLSLLKRFPIGRIKIDKSFVSGLPGSSEDIAIVGAVLSLAQSLDIPVVAEGVEEEAQKLFLTSRHCDDMQGFLLAKPMPGEHLIRQLAEPDPIHQAAS